MIRNKFSKVLLVAVVANSYLLYAAETFHLKNKSADAIQLNITQGSSSTGLKRVAKGGEFPAKKETLPFTLDTNKLSTLEIYYCPTADYCKTNKPDKMVVEFKPGKHSTIHVKFDGKKIGRQVGGKLTGKTTSGSSAKDNIPQDKIIKVSTSSTKEESAVKTTPQAIAEEMERNKPAKPTAPKLTTPEQQEDPIQVAIEAAWAKFPKANALRKEPFSPGKTKTRAAIAGLVLDIEPTNLSESDVPKIHENFNKLKTKWSKDKSINPNVQMEIQGILGMSLRNLIGSIKDRDFSGSATAAQAAPIIKTPEMIEQEALQYFPAIQRSPNLKRDTIEWWFTVLGLSSQLYTDPLYQRAYADRLDELRVKLDDIRVSYDVALNVLAKEIQDPKVLSKFKEIAKKAFDKCTAFVKKWEAEHAK